MAYINQEKKAELAPGIKAVLKKYNVKGSISISHHSTLIVTISSGKMDLMAGKEHPYQPNRLWLEQHGYTGEVLALFKELFAAMMVGNHDNSDSQSDYFDVGWYAYINVGHWDKPYELT